MASKKPTTGDRLNSLEEQVTTLSSAVTDLTSQLGSLVDILQKQQRQNQVATGANGVGQPVQRSGAAPVQQSPIQPQQQYSGEYKWLRLKPENKKRGLNRRSTYLNELAMVIRGGSGQPGDIPIWYAVPIELVPVLQNYTQVEDDPMSAPLFDIVTDEERAQLDAKEEAYRRAQMGVGPHQHVPGIKAPAAQYTDVQQAVRNKAASVPGSEQFASAPRQTIPTEAAKRWLQQNQANGPVKQPVQGGRAAALTGLGNQQDDSDGPIQSDIMDLSQVPVTSELRERITDAANMAQAPGAGDVTWEIAGKQ